MAVGMAGGAASSRGSFMATQPKAQDPTAAALSAIEEALNLAQIAEPSSREPKMDAPKAQNAAPGAPARNETDTEAARAPRRQRDDAEAKVIESKAAAVAAAAPAAANDDRRSV